MDLEAYVNFSMLAIVLIGPIGFTLLRMRKVSKRSTLVIQLLGSGLALYVLAAAVSFLVYTDSLNILVFWVLYAIAFVISILISLVLIFIKTRKQHA